MTNTGVTDEVINTEIFTQEPIPDSKKDIPDQVVDDAVMADLADTIASLEGQYSAVANDLSGSAVNWNDQNTSKSAYRTYIKSEYAPGVSVDISKKFEPVSGQNTLRPYDLIHAVITIRNDSGENIAGAEYLDSLPELFLLDAESKYQVIRSGNSQTEGSIEVPPSGNYDMRFSIGDIGAGETVTVKYALQVLPVSYGEMLVGDFGKNDAYGDVAFKVDNTC